jgi:hypothetical protein
MISLAELAMIEDIKIVQDDVPVLIEHLTQFLCSNSGDGVNRLSRIFVCLDLADVELDVIQFFDFLAKHLPSRGFAAFLQPLCDEKADSNDVLRNEATVLLG